MSRNGAANARDVAFADTDPAFEHVKAEHKRALTNLRERVEELRAPPTPVETPTPILIEAVRRVLAEHGPDHCASCRELASILG